MSLVSNHEIAQAVADLADFLDSYGISFWPEHLRRELDGLRMGDEQASRNLVAHFGGMGNLDDLIITPANGHSVSEAEGESATREMRRHFEKLLQAGLPIRRNWPIGQTDD
jgi:hypothetical protein